MEGIPFAVVLVLIALVVLVGRRGRPWSVPREVSRPAPDTLPGLARIYGGTVDTGGSPARVMRAEVGSLALEVFRRRTSSLESSREFCLRLARQGGPPFPEVGVHTPLVLGERVEVTGLPDHFKVVGAPVARVVEVMSGEVCRAVAGLYEAVPLDDLDIDTRGTHAVEIVAQGWPEDLAASRALVDGAVELVLAMERSLDRWWLAVAREHGLEAVGRSTAGCPILAGEVRGVTVRASVPEEGEWITVVEARGGSPLEAWHPRHAPLALARSPTGNAVVDNLLAVEILDEPAARRLLGDLAFIDALLPVVHGHPGSSLHRGGVRLRARGPLDDHGLSEAVALAVELAAHLPR